MVIFGIEIKRKRKKPSQPLPEGYGQYEREKKLIVLPGQAYTVVEYLEDLIGQLKNDVYPQFMTQGGAPFAVTRTTLCYIDHVSQLMYGPKGHQTPRLVKLMGELGTVDSYLNSNYRKYAPYIVQIHRHDLVHNVRPFPKKIQVIVEGVTTDQESWFFMESIRDGMGFEHNLKVMSQGKSRKGRNHLRLAGNQVVIDTFSLYFDTIIYLQELIEKVQGNSNLEKKIVKNYYQLLHKYYYSIQDFTIDSSANKQVYVK